MLVVVDAFVCAWHDDGTNNTASEMRINAFSKPLGIKCAQCRMCKCRDCAEGDHSQSDFVSNATF